jgi:ComF family protein
LKLSTLAGDLLDVFLPRGCLGCGDRIPPESEEGLVCVRCRTLLRPPPAPRCPRCDVPFGTGRPRGSLCLECDSWPGILRTARAAVVMEAPADALVHALKYEGWQSLAGLLGRRMAAVLLPPTGNPVAVPIPTTPERQRLRGYNQARVLAEVVCREVGLPLVDGLYRARGGTQIRAGPRERKRNVEGVFQVVSSSRSRIRGRDVILIDDVLTTGATASSAAMALGEDGVGSVHLLTFARALPFDSGERRTHTG